MNTKIAILDYGIGNVRSTHNALTEEKIVMFASLVLDAGYWRDKRV